MQQSTPNYSVPTGPSAEQIGIANMGQFAGQPNSLSAILANLSALTQPTMAPSSPAVNVLIGMPSNATTATARGTVPASGGAGPAGSSATPGSASSLLSDAQSASKLYNALTGSGAMGIPSVLSGPQQAALQSAFSAAPVAGSVADAMGMTAGSLAPLAASALAPVGTGAITAAGNAAGASAASELASALGTGAPTATAAAAPAAAAPAASAGTGAGSTSLGALAADALPLAAIGYAANGAMTMPSNNGWSIGQLGALGNQVKNATASGLISPTQTTAGSINPMNANGTVNQPLLNAQQALQQLQLGSFGSANSYVQNLLNGLGYQTIGQQAQGLPVAQGGAPGSLSNLLRQRY